MTADLPSDRTRSDRRRKWGFALLVVAAGLLMGAPTIDGTFVGGDDYRLVLNHVLVSRPSLQHTVELFRIVHRDLYQPLPLLSFSAEFAVAKAFRLFDRGVDHGAWLFHLNNILLHAANALLVFALVRRLRPAPGDAAARSAGVHDTIAVMAALLFALHPLQVEVVAWINGRMMLMSTLFALATLLALDRWMDRKRHSWAALTVLFAVCCAMSKIRVGLPMLMLLVPLARRSRFTPGFWGIWAASAGVTGIFAFINYEATAGAGMFSGAEENLRGPGLVRGLLSLAWYFQHYVYPANLASWYPAPGDVAWVDALTGRALLIVLPVLILAGWCVFRLPAAALGFAWFFFTIASTLQVVPTRNTIAADRYMYLPIVGLAWASGAVVVALVRRWEAGRARSAVRPVTGVAGAVLGLAMLAQSWHVGSFYDEPVVKSMRIAQLFPTAMHVWERAGWSQFNEGRYEEAIELARQEFQHDDPHLLSEANQLIGAALVELGRYEEALEHLRLALEQDPTFGGPYYRLASALDRMGREEEALPYYEMAVEMTPLKNPWIIRVAALYRELGRPADARRLYEQALENNPFEVPAVIGLAELAMAGGSAEAVSEAEERLEALVKRVPDQADAWTTLGVIRANTGQAEKAVEAYARALEEDPAHATAAVNAAQLYEAVGRTEVADRFYRQAAVSTRLTIDKAVVVHNYLVREQRLSEAVALWTGLSAGQDKTSEVLAYRVLATALAAGDPAAVLRDIPGEDPVLLAAKAFAATVDGQVDAAVAMADRLCELGARGAAGREQLVAAMGVAAERNPRNPWPFCLAARVQLCDKRYDIAGGLAGLCEQLCGDEGCAGYLERIRREMGAGQ